MSKYEDLAEAVTAQKTTLSQIKKLHGNSCARNVRDLLRSKAEAACDAWRAQEEARRAALSDAEREIEDAEFAAYEEADRRSAEEAEAEDAEEGAEEEIARVEAEAAHFAELERTEREMDELQSAVEEIAEAMGIAMTWRYGSGIMSRYFWAEPIADEDEGARVASIRISDHAQRDGCGGFNEATQMHHAEADLSLQTVDDFSDCMKLAVAAFDRLLALEKL